MSEVSAFMVYSENGGKEIVGAERGVSEMMDATFRIYILCHFIIL